MGLLERISDLAVGSLTKAETVRIPCEEMALIVEREFVTGSDAEFLKKVLKTAKGGLVLEKEIKSANGRYIFHVGTRPHGLIWLNSKPVWVLDREENKFYQLDKDIKWKKFYKELENAISKKIM